MKVRNKKWVPLSIIILIGFFIGYVLHPINGDWLLGSSPYISLENHGGDMYSPFKRLIHYIIILITMSAFLNLTSQKNVSTHILDVERCLYICYMALSLVY